MVYNRASLPLKRDLTKYYGIFYDVFMYLYSHRAYRSNAGEYISRNRLDIIVEVKKKPLSSDGIMGYPSPDKNSEYKALRTPVGHLIKWGVV